MQNYKVEKEIKKQEVTERRSALDRSAIEEETSTTTKTTVIIIIIIIHYSWQFY
jgi:hypothetical protein